MTLRDTMAYEAHCAHCQITRSALMFREYENGTEFSSDGCCQARIEPQRATAAPVRSSGLAVIGNGLYMRTRPAGDRRARRFSR